jgi:hypothetical protein
VKFTGVILHVLYVVSFLFMDDQFSCTVLLLHNTVPPAYYAHLAAFRVCHYMDDDLSDQGSSSVASSRMKDGAVPVKQLPKVMESDKQFMFYC